MGARQHSAVSGRRRRWWLAAALATMLLAGLALWAAHWVLNRGARTPSEVMVYLERRLEGHPRLEVLAEPALVLLKHTLGSEAETARLQPIALPRLGSNRAAADAGAQPSADAPHVIRVGPGRAIRRIADAARLVPDGGVVEIDPGDYVADTVAWQRASLTIRGLGDRVRIIAAGSDAEGKGIWVVRGGQVTIENIEFVGARVADGNGAGIRLESGQLLVRNCVFTGNESGILTANDERISLAVEGSEFAYTARSQKFTHALYVGVIASLRVTGSYFHHGDRGHLLKSRARFNRIEYNRITDESGGQASYEVNLPNGGRAELVGNIVQQGPGSGNSVIVSYGEEGYRWPENTLELVNNTLVNDMRFGGTFIRVAPGAAVRTVVANTVFVGPGQWAQGFDLDEGSNWRGQWQDLVRPARHDYRLNDAARQALAEKPLSPVPERLLQRAQYQHPRQTQVLAGPVRWPGALQNPD